MFESKLIHDNILTIMLEGKLLLVGYELTEYDGVVSRYATAHRKSLAAEYVHDEAAGREAMLQVRGDEARLTGQGGDEDDDLGHPGPERQVSGVAQGVQRAAGHSRRREPDVLNALQEADRLPKDFTIKCVDMFLGQPAGATIPYQSKHVIHQL